MQKSRLTLAIVFLGLISLLGLSGQTHAQGFLKSGPSVFNYNYIDLKYIDVESTDGLNLQLSADIRDNTAFGVTYYRGSSGPIDADTLGLSLSYYIKARALAETDCFAKQFTTLWKLMHRSLYRLSATQTPAYSSAHSTTLIHVSPLCSR